MWSQPDIFPPLPFFADCESTLLVCYFWFVKTSYFYVHAVSSYKVCQHIWRVKLKGSCPVVVVIVCFNSPTQTPLFCLVAVYVGDVWSGAELLAMFSWDKLIKG